MARHSNHGRFNVWDDGHDPFSHNQLKDNWDRLDAMLGTPTGSGAPGTTLDPTAAGFGSAPTWLDMGRTPADAYSTNDAQLLSDPANIASGGIPRNLYNIIQGLVYNQSPLGEVIEWWRPNDTIAVPVGWRICDGSTIAAAEHSYVGIGSLTLPDLRNSFVLGANVANADASAGSAADAVANAPGIRGAGGTNATHNETHHHSAGTLFCPSHTHAIPHDHTVGDHLHAFDHTHEMQHVHYYDHYHYSSLTIINGDSHDAFDSTTNTTWLTGAPAGGAYGSAVNPDLVATHTLTSGSHKLDHSGARSWVGSQYSLNPDGTGGTHNPNVSPPVAGGSGTVNTGRERTLGDGPFGYASYSGGLAIGGGTDIPVWDSNVNDQDLRPKYVGLLYLIKVRKIYHLTNETFETQM